MNKKGFTLVELLATMAILGIIMLIAVPNVISIIDNNKRTTYIEDAKRLVALAETKFRSDESMSRPAGSSDCLIINLNDLDKSNLSEAPENGTYDIDDSYVVIKFESNSYTYYVQLKEKYGASNDNYRGISYIKSSKLNETGAMRKYVKSDGFVDSSCSNVSQ